MNVFVVYRDMRAYGLREDLYRQARSQGIAFIRRDMDKELTVGVDEEDLKVTFADRVLGRSMEIRPDLLILASAIVPDAKNPLAQLYKVSLNNDGFFCRSPCETQTRGFCHGRHFCLRFGSRTQIPG